MLKTFLKPSIIVLIQGTVLAALIFCLAPLLLAHTDSMKHWQYFFKQFQWLFLVGHIIFYWALYCLWPLFIRLIINQQQHSPTPEQLAKALNARVVLIGIFIAIELLNYLR